MAKILFLTGSIAAAILFVVLQFTTPATIHPVGLLGVFVLLYILLAVATTYLIYIMSHFLERITGSAASKPRVQGLELSRAYIYGTVLAFAPIILISMQSVGGVGAIDVVLVVVFEVVACLYVWRRN